MAAAALFAVRDWSTVAACFCTNRFSNQAHGLAAGAAAVEDAVRPGRAASDGGPRKLCRAFRAGRAAAGSAWPDPARRPRHG